MARARVALVMTLLMWAIAAGPARAANDVVVGSSAGRVVVQRDPLRISYVDASGRTVLRQVSPAGGLGLVPPVPENQFGTQGSPPPALYAPFAFLAGSHKVNQTPSGQWVATLQNV